VLKLSNFDLPVNFKMDTKHIKRKLFDKCVEMHLAKIRNLEIEMEEAEQSANEYGQESDIFDSQKMQLIGKRDMFAAQLQKEALLTQTLFKVDPAIKSEKVEFGSVVITDDQNIFIAIGLGKINLNGETFFTISAKVPFYEAMKGLKKGDSFIFNGRKITIKEVY